MAAPAVQSQASSAPARPPRRHRPSLLAGLPPSGVEVALATVVGAASLALGNAAAIAATVPWPRGGAALRLRHHIFDLVQTLGLGVFCAALPLVLSLLARRSALARRRRWLGWAVLGWLCLAAMDWLLGPHLERQALVLLGGRLSWLLYPLYVLLCGLAVPGAFVLGAGLGRRRWLGALPVGAGAAGMVVGHAILRDDYPGLHAAIAWSSACLLGAGLAPRLGRWRRGRRATVVALAVCAAAALVVAPSNPVRLELFREPGSVAAWVLARALWRPPELRPAAAAGLAPAYEPRAAPPTSRAGSGAGRLPPDPVVVLITVDALRTDVVADPRNDAELPVLAALRGSGAYVERAVAAGSQTSLTLTTMFTGRYFSQLHFAPYGEGRNRFLCAAGDPAVRFPEILSAAGVQTMSVVGLIFIAGRFGVARGFADEQVVVRGREHAMAQDVVRPLLRRLRTIRRGRHFLYAHLLEPHEPYDRGKVREGPDYRCYVSEVAAVDQWLGQLWDVLRRRFRGRGYLIVTGDHGEAFGEHDTHFHTSTLYDEMVRVPLVIWGPGIPARRLDEGAGLVDLGPTILDLFGLATPAAFMGQSLLPLLGGRAGALARPLVAEGRLRRALFRPDGLKVIEDGRRKVVEVYDLRSDPGETHNLFDEEPERVHPAVAELRAFFARHARHERDYEPPYKR
ncbi:MAG: sulfatase-like hydrolase/transferase [Deltaproteobacteria bacterium]|nr:sulfatase-like hydrolase/transferase [Deltaproteobacteria bacterium]